MIIGGLQKMTVLDFPGKIACTVFTQGCNFKCPFCHNASLVRGEADIIKEEEIFKYLEKRKGILDGVCITGGEPLIQEGIFDFIKKIKDMGLLVKLDTNGYFPDKLEYAIDNSLIDYVAMDIKNCKDKYALTCGQKNFKIENIEKSVEILMNSALDYEFRTTVTQELHTACDMAKIGEWIKGAKRYFIQNYVHSDNILLGSFTSLDTQALNTFLSSVLPFVPTASLRGV